MAVHHVSRLHVAFMAMQLGNYYLVYCIMAISTALQQLKSKACDCCQEPEPDTLWAKRSASSRVRKRVLAAAGSGPAAS